MIKQEIAFSIHCDLCGRQFKGWDYLIFGDRDWAIEWADAEDWLIDRPDKKDICNECRYSEHFEEAEEE